jgi:hypothetical protein
VRLFALFDVCLSWLWSILLVESVFMLMMLLWRNSCQIVLVYYLRLEDLAVIKIAIVISHVIISSVGICVHRIHWYLITIYEVLWSSVVCAHEMLIHVWIFMRLYTMCHFFLEIHLLVHHCLLLRKINIICSIIKSIWHFSLWILRCIFCLVLHINRRFTLHVAIIILE